ncbi:rhodanese-related sulfurtransferase [Kineosphaera limosa]|uniref:Rhodanese domain-containing protein n=1 Tax=Kineosphaera limosa NBRC 100340 TaxID=1184609 RepID=K6WT63_9MICO|nr:hypothetical protein [Kineosphaera limosa]NYE00388.1 rhodanese-related sulfurtransferase [Kineosphaera limosa]GAB97026.1 hypothetical protein KILIM_054_00370 [Kineosphaera limosa NBRC 100340]
MSSTRPFDLDATLTRTRSHARWQIDLFAPAPASNRDRVSVRGAYQDALYERALILDLRADTSSGQLPADLALRVRPGVDLAALAGRAVLYLLVDDADAPIVEPAAFAAFAPERPRIVLIDGGITAWRAAGLPLTLGDG